MYKWRWGNVYGNSGRLASLSIRWICKNCSGLLRPSWGSSIHKLNLLFCRKKNNRKKYVQGLCIITLSSVLITQVIVLFRDNRGGKSWNRLMTHWLIPCQDKKFGLTCKFPFWNGFRCIDRIYCCEICLCVRATVSSNNENLGTLWRQSRDSDTLTNPWHVTS